MKGYTDTFMLTEKYKDFIENTALKFQSNFKETKEPNKYNYLEVQKWLESMGAEFRKGDGDYTRGNVIYLSFFDNERLNINDNMENTKKLFHEVWHFISNRINGMQNQNDEATPIQSKPDYYNDKPIQVVEISANYFSRAMLLPEKNFVQSVMKNLNVNGSCDIFEVAKEFCVSYVDVIARGNDLNIWNTKGGRQ